MLNLAQSNPICLCNRQTKPTDWGCESAAICHLWPPSLLILLGQKTDTRFTAPAVIEG